MSYFGFTGLSCFEDTGGTAHQKSHRCAGKGVKLGMTFGISEMFPSLGIYENRLGDPYYIDPQIVGFPCCKDPN